MACCDHSCCPRSGSDVCTWTRGAGPGEGEGIEDQCIQARAGTDGESRGQPWRAAGVVACSCVEFRVCSVVVVSCRA